MKFPQLLSISSEFGNFLKEEICMSLSNAFSESRRVRVNEGIADT
jgi:hypothetical protein